MAAPQNHWKLGLFVVVGLVLTRRGQGPRCAAPPPATAEAPDTTTG
jgi:hypothetical protein